jgi:hypothetical protein
MIESGLIVTPDEVLVELERGGDEIHAWATAHDNLGVEPDERVQAIVRRIVDDWPAFLPEDSHDGVWADPYVIGMASVRGATVVTGEVPAPDDALRPRTPDICHELGIDWVTILALLPDEGMRL